MEREFRNRDVLAALRRSSSHPLVWIAIAAFVAWRGYAMYAPDVARVERDGEGRLIISGRNFGPARGDSALMFSVGGKEIEIDVDEWANDRIIAKLRGEVASGSVSVKRAFWFFYWPSSAAALVVAEEGLPSQPFGYEIPVQAGSPWPTFRRDVRNSGQSPIAAVYGGDAPWAFETGDEVLSTPVIDDQGVAYFGSTDHNFYAVAADGSERWRYRTGGVVDSAAALLRPRAAGRESTVVFGSGDGYLYRLRLGREIPSPAAREAWVFDSRVATQSTYYGRFEGNVSVGYDGTLYASNTNSNYYAVNRQGEMQWAYETAGGSWSAGAFGFDGTIFWGSSDGYVHALNPNGTEKWAKRTWGVISASPAVGSDGRVYVGSFDSYMYALDPDDGSTAWTFKTANHIAGSAALGYDADGRTDAIYFGSTDGRVYAVDPKGELLWKYDTGDPVRSSPAVGRGPEGERPGIVYVGSGNGVLYALNAADGKRRWSFDTTPRDADLRDRNDLNGSVALGTNGIYVGSEAGRLWYIPYDYCLHAEDPRCTTAPGEDLPKDIARVVYVSPGGTTQLDDAVEVSPSTVITLRLLVRNRSRTLDAHFCTTPIICWSSDIQVETDPPFEFRVEQSGDGRYLHIIPEKILKPGASYRIRAEGDYYTGGFHFGNLTVGGSRAGRFNGGVTIRTRPSTGSSPWSPQQGQALAFELRRLAVPIPSMLTSVNQGTFKDREWIFSVVDARPSGGGEGRLVVWGIGGQRDARGVLIADPASHATLALSGTFAGDSMVAFGRNFDAEINGFIVPIDELAIRGQFDSNMRALPGATVFAEVDALSVRGLGPSLVTAGLANGVYGNVVVAGTYMTRPYPQSAPANKRPPGLQVSFVEYAQSTDRLPGQVVVHFRLARGAHYKLAEHRLGILLIDRQLGEVVPLDYRQQLSTSASEQGDVSQVVLTIPAAQELSRDLGIIVLADAFPIHREKLKYRPQAK